MNVCSLPASMKDKLVTGFFDDFLSYNDGDLWTKLAADTTPTVAAEASGRGRLKLFTDSTDNNECAASTTVSIFKDLADKPMFCEALVQYAEANTDDANIAVGFCSVMRTANTLVDNGAGLVTTYDGHVIYKVDGETVWRCGSSRGTTQYTTTSNKTAGGTTAQKLRIEVQPEDSTTCTVRYYVDDEQLKDSNNVPIVHTLLLASAAAMQAGIAVKTGGSQSENVYVDYFAAYQLR